MGHSSLCNSAVILTGGSSSRMGREKASLAVGGRSIICRQLAVLEPLFDELFLVGKRPEGDLGIPQHIGVVADEVPEKGPLGGIYTALGAARSEAVFVVACDMPFLDADLIRRLLDAVDGSADAVVLRHGDFVEPLHAIYLRRITPVIRRLLDRGQLKVRGIIEQVNATYVDVEPTHRGLFNVNRPGDLKGLSDRG